MPLDAYVPPPTHDGEATERRPIVGYTAPDGSYCDFRGWVVAFSPDSLRFVAPKVRTTSEGDFERARSEVATVSYREGDAVKTGALVVGILAGVLGGLAVLIAASGGIGVTY